MGITIHSRLAKRPGSCKSCCAGTLTYVGSISEWHLHSLQYGLMVWSCLLVERRITGRSTAPKAEQQLYLPPVKFTYQH